MIRSGVNSLAAVATSVGVEAVAHGVEIGPEGVRLAGPLPIGEPAAGS